MTPMIHAAQKKNPSKVISCLRQLGASLEIQDEIGTPFCITVDSQTLQDQSVTVRERDSMTQERIATDKLLSYLKSRLSAA